MLSRCENGRYLSYSVVNLLNSPCGGGGGFYEMRMDRSIPTNSYSDFRTWLLSATATNMAYMLSAQLVALKLDVYFNKVDGNAFDLCSQQTVNQLMSTACDQ